MEDNLIFIVNGKQAIFFKWKTASFYVNGGQPPCFVNGRRPKFLVNRKCSKICLLLEDEEILL